MDALKDLRRRWDEGELTADELVSMALSFMTEGKVETADYVQFWTDILIELDNYT